MAQILTASIYNLNGQSIGTAQGQTFGFPVQGIIIRPVPTGGQTANGVTINSIIQMLPAGTRVGQDQYGSVSTVAALITASNA